MSDIFDKQEVIDALIRRIFSIQDITQGSAQLGFLMRYRGRLIRTILSRLTPNCLNGSSHISLRRSSVRRETCNRSSWSQALPAPKAGKASINLLMFILTVISVVIAGGLFNLTEDLPTDPIQAAILILQTGWPFAVALLAILGTHEFGHYFAGDGTQGEGEPAILHPHAIFSSRHHGRVH